MGSATRHYANALASVQASADELSYRDKLALIKSVISSEDFDRSDIRHVSAIDEATHELWMEETAEPMGSYRDDAADRAHFESLAR